MTKNVTDYVCQDANICVNQVLFTGNTSPNGTICCTGYQSCSRSKNITSVVSNSYQYNNNSIAIRCDAQYSCSVPNWNSDVRYRSGNGNIYMTGAEASVPDDVDSYPYATIATYNGLYDIFCTSIASCSFQYIRNAKNVYCTALESCIFLPLITNVENVFSYGSRGMR